MQMRDGRGAWDQKNVRRATKKPGECQLHRRGMQTRSYVGQRRRLQRAEATERKERHIRDAFARKLVDQRIIGPVRQIVVVLHADNVADPACFRDLRRRDVAQPDVTH